MTIHEEPSASGKKVDDNDVLIAVLGATGVGKSSFINLATQSDVKLVVSGGSDSCTSTVDVAPPFELDGRRVILYDTPGFDDSHKTESEILKVIASELEKQYRQKPPAILHGLIYLHPIHQIRVTGVTKANFGLMRKLCGDTSLRNVVIVTNQWSRLKDDNEGWDRVKDISSPTGFLADALAPGKDARLAHNFDNTVDSVRDIISSIIHNHPAPLLVQEELVDEKKNLTETSAGKEVDKRIVELEEKLKKQMAEQLEEAKQAQKERDLITVQEKEEEAEKFRKEIERLNNERANIDRTYAARMSQLEADVRAARAVPRPAAPRSPPAVAPRPPPSVQTPPRSPSPTTFDSITSGEKHTIRSVKWDRFVTVDSDEKTVTGQRRGGTGQRWIFTKVSSGNWIIESSRYDRYLSTTDNGRVRARTQPEEWKIKRIPGAFGEFRLYNDAWADDKVLSLDDRSVGTHLSLVKRRARQDEIWEIDEI